MHLQSNLGWMLLLASTRTRQQKDNGYIQLRVAVAHAVQLHHVNIHYTYDS